MGGSQKHTVPSTAGGWLHVILRAIDALGLDGDRLALTAGISPRNLQARLERIPQPLMTRLWRLAQEATKHPYLGLHVARFVTPSTFGALSHATYASSTLESAFNRIVRYQHLLTDSLQLGIEQDEHTYRLTIEPWSDEEPPAVEIDAFCATWVRGVREYTAHKGFVEPLRIRWRRPKPRPSALYRRVFRAPIEFGADCSFIEYARADCEMLLPELNADLARHYERLVANDAAQLGTVSLSERVRGALIESLADGPSQTAIAQALHMSKSSLKNALAREGNTFQEILNEIRLGLASDYLREGNYSIKEIAFLLGFSDATTFTRAFRSWTGLPPGRFVSQQRLAGRRATPRPKASLRGGGS